MTSLCIDTATENGMVVVARDDGSIAAVKWRSAGRHAEHLLGYIETALVEAGVSRDELTLIGVDIGPGGFTSLRVGLATAKGLALGLGLPIVGVSSLRVLARSIEASASTVRVPVMNAYRGDVFAGAYLFDSDEADEPTELVPAVFGAPEQVFGQIRVAAGDRPISVAGEAAKAKADAIRSSLGIELDIESLAEAATPDAIVAEVRHIVRLYGPSDLSSLEPQYLRPSDAKLPARPLRREDPT